MSFIEWDKSYSVGDKEIDRQHKELMGLINALFEYKEKDNYEFVSRVLSTLVEYTKKHFYLEEKMLESVNFPELEQHKKQHRSFIEKVQGFQSEFESGDEDVSDRILNFLRMWLTSHILIHDKAYQRFITTYSRYT